MTQQDIFGKAKIMKFQKVTISENRIDPTTFIVIATCRKGQKWQKRKHKIFKKWINREKPVFTNLIYKTWRDKNDN